MDDDRGDTVVSIEAGIEELVQSICRLSRDELGEVLRTIESPFPIDFTADYLEGLTVDRLRHIVLAVCLQVRKRRVA